MVIEPSEDGQRLDCVTVIYEMQLAVKHTYLLIYKKYASLELQLCSD